MSRECAGYETRVSSTCLRAGRVSRREPEAGRPAGYERKEIAVGVELERVAAWIAEQVENAGARGAVFGLSGGLDSAVVAALCSRALPGAAVALIMPCHSGQRDLDDALLVAEAFDLETLTIDLTGVYDSFLRVLPAAGQAVASNLKPRLRMTALYHVARARGHLVVGTGNRSELMVGYFTKYGDGGADIMPIAGLYKTDLFDIARLLGVPESIIEKAPSAGLWEGQTDEGEMGVSYRELDGILKALESGGEPDSSPGLVEKVRLMAASSEHKRNLPPLFDPCA